MLAFSPTPIDVADVVLKVNQEDIHNYIPMVGFLQNKRNK